MRRLTTGLVIFGWALLSIAASAEEPPKPLVPFDHKGTQRTMISQLSLKSGQAFDIVITNTAEACFDYSVERVERTPPSGLEGVRVAVKLATKTLTLVHDERYGGYIVSIQRTSNDEGCGQGEAGALLNSMIIVSVETPGWEVEMSGGFTVSGLTDTVYGVTQNAAGDDIIIEDLGAQDDASLGVASFLQVYRRDQPWWAPGLGFGLGINQTSKPTYHLGAFWRLGRSTMLGGGVVLGSIARLPVGVDVGGELTSPNVLTDLPTRVDTQWFFGISFSFLGGREPFDKPFAPPQQASSSAE